MSLLSARQVFILGLNFAAWRVVVNFRFGGARPRRLLVHTHILTHTTTLTGRGVGEAKINVAFRIFTPFSRGTPSLSLKSFVCFRQLFRRYICTPQFNTLAHSHTHTHWHSHFLSFLFVVVVVAPLLTAKPLPFSDI